MHALMLDRPGTDSDSSPPLRWSLWALLAWSASLPVALVLLLRALRPDLIDPMPAVLIAAPLASIPFTFGAQLIGFLLVARMRLPGLIAALGHLIAWAVPAALIMLPALWLTLVAPIVSAFFRMR